jgi:hypothetical protein
MEIDITKIHYEIDMEALGEAMNGKSLAKRMKLVSTLYGNVCFWFPASNDFFRANDV